MATSDPKTQARKTARASKSTAGKARRGADQAARSTQRAARTTAAATQATGREAAAAAGHAQRTLSGLVRDGAYAAVGLTDSTVELLRHATQRAERLRASAPKAAAAIGPRARHLAEVAPVELRSAVTGLVSEAAASFDGYAERGRSVLGSITRSRPTGRAVDQARTARSQVKAATTSVRKAVEETAGAAASAADKVGAEGR